MEQKQVEENKQEQVNTNQQEGQNGLLNQEDSEQYLDILIEHQVNCEKAGKYVEANLTKNKIAELKQNLEKKRKDEMKNRQFQEDQNVEQAHLREYNQFNEFWDKKMNEFNDYASKIQNELIGKQQEEYQKLSESLEQTLPYKPRDSSEVLNLKKIEEHLAKQKNYVEAHQVQQRRLEQEKIELNNWMQIRQQKIKNQLGQLKQRQNNELNALNQKITAGQDEQKKTRADELEKLLQKYYNVKKELDAQHEKEILAENKQFKTKAATSLQSKYQSQRMNSSSNKD